MTKTNVLLIAAFIIISAVGVQAQESKKPGFVPNNSYSIAAGYGSQGLFVKGDYKIGEIDILNNPAAKLYIDFNIKGKTFDQSTFIFSSVPYPSDVNQYMIGIGGGLDFKFNHLSVSPYIGARYYYVRFKDMDLFDAIGESNLIRFRPGSTTIQVGPTVDNGYGNTFSIDLGTWIGYHISPTFEIGGSIGISPAKFSTAASLYGKYWGEAPYENWFHVKIDPIRLQAGIKLNF